MESQKKFDKRLCFVKQACLRFPNQTSVQIANDWYNNNKAAKLNNEEALRKFALWCGAPVATTQP